MSLSIGQHYVIKTTTEHLADNLDEIVHDGREVLTVQWLGGRDWVIVGSPARLQEALAESVTVGCCGRGEGCSSPTCTGTPRGWVDDQDRRHARFDQVRDHYDGGRIEEFFHLVDPEVEWGGIKYGRYDTNRVPTGHEFSGWIEDHARSWIIFLGEHGAPLLYWPRRDAQGGVIGSPINLAT